MTNTFVGVGEAESEQLILVGEVGGGGDGGGNRGMGGNRGRGGNRRGRMGGGGGASRGGSEGGDDGKNDFFLHRRSAPAMDPTR